ncbi:MAG: VWA domain-containing protein, partial [Bacteroidetes bacterium]|nr:VWA domain-containing protein [Bacteroidota bacterium]
MRNRYFHIISLLFVLSIWVSAAYSQKTYDPDLTRILFVLDASGSMNEDWGERSKYESAKKLLFSVADSLTANNRKVQFGLRMFGHQKPKAEYDCKDSKLEVPFSANNSFRFTNALNEATPQGWTPIAYSLFLAANDFPADNRSTNAIVLITDGLETCEGDPCASALILQKKRIAIKPFIIGLGIGEDGRKAFDCVGTYYDASDENSFKHIINVVVSQALNTTTAQVNLLNAYGKPTETNVEMTFNDSHSGAILYNFVHTMDATGVPDTLFLDPVGKYDLTIHSIPPVTKTGIELIPGKH